MKLLLKCFYDICLLRAGPQDLPASTFLMVLVLFAYVLAGVMLSSLQMDWWQALLLLAADVGLLGGLAYLILWVRQLGARFVQVFTALLGTGTFFEILALPLLYWQREAMAAFQNGTDEGSGTVFISAFVLWLVLFWSLVVIGHILRHALSTNMPVGMALAVLYMFISVALNQQLVQPMLAA